MGTDQRSYEKVIQSDAADIACTGKTITDIVARMRDISALAERGLGANVTINENIQASATDTRGKIPCPWQHPGLFKKTVTTVKRLNADTILHWSDLSIHLIEKHGFFQGYGSPFRLAPKELVQIIFPA